MKKNHVVFNILTVVAYFYGVILCASLVLIPLGVYAVISAHRYSEFAEMTLVQLSQNKNRIKKWVVFGCVLYFPIGLLGLLTLSSIDNNVVVEDAQPNAFATGRNPENAVVCVTTGLLEKLDYYELEGVLAHELAHIKNYDIRLSAVVSVMVGFVVMLSDLFTRIAFWGGFRDNDDDNSKGNAIIMIIGLIFLILSPIFGQLMQLALSRKREYLADATAIQFTRNPDGLISALIKISDDPNQLKVANNATENMYIASPFKNKKKSSNWWSTHPSVEDRVEALRNLK